MKKDLGTMAGNGMAVEIAFRDHTRGAGPERGVAIGVGLRFAKSEAGDGNMASCGGTRVRVTFHTMPILFQKSTRISSVATCRGSVAPQSNGRHLNAARSLLPLTGFTP
jgi:hypothetical protein